jgi:hypothetical protein
LAEGARSEGHPAASPWTSRPAAVVVDKEHLPGSDGRWLSNGGIESSGPTEPPPGRPPPSRRLEVVSGPRPGEDWRARDSTLEWVDSSIAQKARTLARVHLARIEFC